MRENGKLYCLFANEKLLKVVMKLPEQLDRPLARFGHPGAAAAFSTGGQLHEWLLGLSVHGVDEVPSMAVGHLHRFGRPGDGAVLHNALEQDHAAVADEGPFRAVDPDAAAEARSGFPVCAVAMGFLRHGS